MTVSKDHVIKRQGKEFILYVGLLAEAHERGLVGIKTTLIQIPTAENGHVAIVHATAEMKDGRTFDGIGDADFANVGPNIKPHIIRMAETRAKARAMRDATNIGITAFEELGGGDEDEAHAPTPETTRRTSGPRRQQFAGNPADALLLNTETGEIFDIEGFRAEVRAAVVTVAQAENREAQEIFLLAARESGVSNPKGFTAFNRDELTKIRDWCSQRIEVLA